METESWQLETRAAERYEAIQVPALMAVWAPRLVAAAGVQAGDRVLDLACGTGIVAVAALEHVGPGGSVIGLDLNPAMLAVARQLRPGITWERGDATNLPFADAAFDRVLCQFSLMYVPDRHAALLEVRRVLRPCGSLAFTTWAAIERNPLFDREAKVLAHFAGSDAVRIAHAPFLLADPAELERMLSHAGFTDIKCSTITETARYADVEVFLEGELDATPLGAALRAGGDTLYNQGAAALRKEVEAYEGPDGVVFPITANVVAARSM